MRHYRKHQKGRVKSVYTYEDGKHWFIHRMLLAAPAGMNVDHVNGNVLDNRRANLRLCSVAENQRNIGKRVTNTSGYKGVYKQGKSWVAEITVDRKTFYLGAFQTPLLAHGAYAQAARKYHGDFARVE